MKKYFVFFAIVLFAMPMFTFAIGCGNVAAGQPPCSPLGTVPDNANDVGTGTADPLTGTLVTTYTAATFVASIIGLVNWFSWFIGLAAVVMGLYAGFLFITGGDNATQIASARKIMLYAIIGIAVAIISFGLIAISRSVLVI